MANGDLTYSQLEGLWTSAGGSTALAPLMAAIALAESGGNPDAENLTDNNGTQTSWGLWQISNGTHDMPVPNILSPEVNAQQAVLKYQEQGLGAWGTYTSGAYQQYYQSGITPSQYAGQSATLTDSTQTLSGNGGISIWTGIWGGVEGLLHGFSPAAIAGGIENPPANPLSSIGDVANALKVGVDDFKQLLTWMSWLFSPSSWLRIGAFVLGVLSLGAGIYMFKEAI